MEHKKREIWALVILTVTVLVGCSLVSFDPADPTFFGSSAGHGSPHNWVGALGANLAWCLFFLFGVGAYALPAVGLWLGYAFLRGQDPLPYGRLQVLGLALLLLSLIGLAALHGSRITFLGAQVLAGGQIGALMAAFLRDRVNDLGAHVLLGSLFLISLILSTPFSLKAAGRKFLDLFRWIGAKIVSLPPLRSPGNPREERSAVRITKAKSQATGKKRQTSPNPEPPAAARPQPPRDDKPVQLAAVSGRYALPAINLLDFYDAEDAQPDPTLLEEKARVLEEKLADFGVQGQVVGISPGPVITMYEYAPAPGIKISRIVGLADDLSMALRAESVRVVAPIPGKAAIGIEIPNERRAAVSLRSIIESKPFASSTFPLTLALGKDITGQPVVTNLTRMPHLLIAGATGTGKSVCINAMLLSLLYRNTPETLRLLMIDPKRIELSSYEKIPHLLHPVVTEPKMATRALRWAVQEMELRYKLLADMNVRNIESYNRLMSKADPRKDGRPEPAETENGTVLDHHHLPYIVVVIDELADLMMVASREVEEYITRLAQMARAAGIHLILATQRPSVDVLTGIIKANIPTRISFQVSSKVDSRTILDTNGAETLLGAGDMLFMPPGTAKLQRIQGAFVSDAEVQRVTSFWKGQQLGDDPMADRVNFEETGVAQDIPDDELDEKYEEAVRLVVETRQASISMIQRRLRIGYNRAARMIEIMEQQGIVGPSDGSKPREVLVPKDGFES